jgi:hypothetical protein
MQINLFMKKSILALVTLIAATHFAFSQDEGAVVKRERIQLDKSIFVGGGVSSVLGNNFGDYSTGINFEAGYLKRLNRVISIGGSVSYLNFKYDANVIKSKPDVNGTGLSQDFYYDTQAASITEGYYLTLTGGDLSIISLAGNIKVNFVPVKDNSVISVYGFAKPFIASSKRSDVTGTLEYIYTPDNTNWYYDTSKNTGGTYTGESTITGGIFLGPGVELFPAKKVSFFAQASFGYTFPIDIVSTRSYGNDLTDLTNAKFPVSSLGFTSINFAGGISFNLD